MNAKQWNGDEPDPYPDGRPDDPEPPPGCMRHGCTGDMVAPVSIAGLGAFCTRACAEAEQAEFRDYLKRNGFQKVS